MERKKLATSDNIKYTSVNPLISPTKKYVGLVSVVLDVCHVYELKRNQIQMTESSGRQRITTTIRVVAGKEKYLLTLLFAQSVSLFLSSSFVFCTFELDDKESSFVGQDILLNNIW